MARTGREHWLAGLRHRAESMVVSEGSRRTPTRSASVGHGAADVDTKGGGLCQGGPAWKIEDADVSRELEPLQAMGRGGAPSSSWSTRRGVALQTQGAMPPNDDEDDLRAGHPQGAGQGQRAVHPQGVERDDTLKVLNEKGTSRCWTSWTPSRCWARWTPSRCRAGRTPSRCCSNPTCWRSATFWQRT